MTETLSQTEQEQLLIIARQALETSVHNKSLPILELGSLPPVLRENGASFVTLTISGRLRGCIGALQAYQPLAKDVQEHAMAAALQDFRFPQVQPAELPAITVEVSVLTSALPLVYDGPEDLLDKLNPGEDGLVLADGYRKATFLPQVWDSLPTPEEFLSHLCLKMGAPSDLWKTKNLDVSVYHVQEFHE